MRSAGSAISGSTASATPLRTPNTCTAIGTTPAPRSACRSNRCANPCRTRPTFPRARISTPPHSRCPSPWCCGCGARDDANHPEGLRMPHLPRILLINPTMTSRRSARFPLALLHLSAALDRTMAASSQIIDGNVDRDFITAILRALESDRFDLVGITVMGGPQLAPAIAVSRAIRERFPGLPIAWGGYFPTLNTEAAIGSSYVDYVIRGPGDKTLPELVRSEEHTSELQSLMRISYAVLCLNKKNISTKSHHTTTPSDTLYN